MRNSKLLDMKMLKRPLLLAVIATFAAGCATNERVARYESPAEVNWTGPAGPRLYHRNPLGL